MSELSGWLIFFMAGGALLLLAFAGFWIVAVARSFARGRRSGVTFPREHVRLLRDAASALGAEAVTDGDGRIPYLKSRPPDPAYGLALAPSGDDPGYFPIFEAPVVGSGFLEAWPAGSPFAPTRVGMGGGGVSVGDREFDAAYVVRADDPDFARSVLGPEARALLDSGRRIGSGGRVRFNLDSLRLRVRKEEALAKPDDLAAFARVGIGLLERVREAAEGRQAVQFYDVAPLAADRPPCPVCAGAIADNKIACRRCRTPHHRECWEYARGCSMFACGETRFSL